MTAYPMFVGELPVAELGIDVDVHAVDLLGEPLPENLLLLAVERHLLQTQVVLVERGDVRGDDLNQLDDLAQLVAVHVLRLIGR